MGTRVRPRFHPDPWCDTAGSVATTTRLRERFGGGCLPRPLSAKKIIILIKGEIRNHKLFMLILKKKKKTNKVAAMAATFSNPPHFKSFKYCRIIGGWQKQEGFGLRRMSRFSRTAPTTSLHPPASNAHKTNSRTPSDAPLTLLVPPEIRQPSRIRQPDIPSSY